ncbi:MAG: hypothetical protein JO293_04770 [Candidatus Eremiobacteraeota bacterium]|nr:hypothetical protein [Candidatus Eremiobacteraeota bacterium]
MRDELEQLWASVPVSSTVFDPAALGSLPDPARKYLRHSIAPGTPLASAVRLRMHGEIKVGKWLPFTADEVICSGVGYIWNATTRAWVLPVSAKDRLVNGVGSTSIKLFGIIPYLSESGPDISRSAAGRYATELCWLPSALCDPAIAWSAPDDRHAVAHLAIGEERMELTIEIDRDGRPGGVALERWVDQTGDGFEYVPFGGFVEEERTFSGFTIASRLRAGYFVGSDRFAAEGEFFRCAVDDAQYR